MKRLTADHLIVTAAGGVIVALTGAAFWLSYAHLAEIASAHGLSGARAWAWPATLDLGIVAGELLMLRAALQRRTDRWAIALVVAGAGGSIALNVAGVGQNAGLLDHVVAAVPPSAALIAFGVLMRQVHGWLARGQEPAPEPSEHVIICDGGGLAVPIVPPRPSKPRRPQTKAAKPKSRRRTDAELLTHARRETADWPTDRLTADRIREVLRIAPDRARGLRDTLRAERAEADRDAIRDPEMAGMS